MSAVSPEVDTGDRIAIKITVDGTEFEADEVVSIQTWSAANRIPRARIAIYDGQPDTEDFPLSESKTFAPGGKVEISAGYGSKLAVIHKGTIIRHSIRIVPGAAAQLIVETADPLLAMTLARKSEISANASDADIIAKLVAAGGGSVAKNEAGKTKHEAFVQYHATDWDLMLLRAEASGCIVLVDDSKASVVSPTASSEPVLDIVYGDTVIAFEATIDAAAEYTDSAIGSRSWSYAAQSLTEGAAGAAEVTVPGNFKSKTLAGVLGVAEALQRTGATLSADELAAWSTATLMRAKLAQMQGSVRFHGSALAKPGTFLKLSGLGDRFNGKAFVGGVHHAIRDGEWLTTAQLGMSAEAFASQGQIAAPPAAGRAPPMRGLHTGQVKKVAADPNGDFRVQVTLPLTGSQEGVWARLGSFYASNAFGAGFFPEVGDEVILAFMDEDPANPVILSSVYSSTRAPTYPPDEQNDKKAIVTRSKMEITFDDKDVILEVKTPAGRKLRLDDKAKEVLVEDPFGNKLSMTQAKVAILSGAAMELTSKTNMTIDCGAQLTVTAKAGYSLKAPTIKETADASLSLVSSGVGELKAGAVLTINGALVKIN